MGSRSQADPRGLFIFAATWSTTEMRVTAWLLILLTLWSSLALANLPAWEEFGHDHVHMLGMQADDGDRGGADHADVCNHTCHGSSHLLGIVSDGLAMTSPAAGIPVAQFGQVLVSRSGPPPYHPPNI